MKNEHIILKKRKELGMTQQELAKILNVTDKTVSRWENGITPPSQDMIPQIVKILGITYEAYFGSELEEDKSHVPINMKYLSYIALTIFFLIGMILSISLYSYFYFKSDFDTESNIRIFNLIINVKRSFDLYLLQTWIHVFVLGVWFFIFSYHFYLREIKSIRMDIKIFIVFMTWALINYLNLIDIYSEHISDRVFYGSYEMFSFFGNWSLLIIITWIVFSELKIKWLIPYSLYLMLLVLFKYNPDIYISYMFQLVLGITIAFYTLYQVLYWLAQFIKKRSIKQAGAIVAYFIVFMDLKFEIYNELYLLHVKPFLNGDTDQIFTGYDTVINTLYSYSFYLVVIILVTYLTRISIKRFKYIS